jgi:hypothetical protein
VSIENKLLSVARLTRRDVYEDLSTKISGANPTGIALQLMSVGVLLSKADSYFWPASIATRYIKWQQL